MLYTIKSRAEKRRAENSKNRNATVASQSQDSASNVTNQTQALETTLAQSKFLLWSFKTPITEDLILSVQKHIREDKYMLFNPVNVTCTCDKKDPYKECVKALMDKMIYFHNELKPDQAHYRMFFILTSKDFYPARRYYPMDDVFFCPNTYEIFLMEDSLTFSDFEKSFPIFKPHIEALKLYF